MKRLLTNDELIALADALHRQLGKEVDVRLIEDNGMVALFGRVGDERPCITARAMVTERRGEADLQALVDEMTAAWRRWRQLVRPDTTSKSKSQEPRGRAA